MIFFFRLSFMRLYSTHASIVVNVAGGLQATRLDELDREHSSLLEMHHNPPAVAREGGLNIMDAELLQVRKLIAELEERVVELESGESAAALDAREAASNVAEVRKPRSKLQRACTHHPSNAGSPADRGDVRWYDVTRTCDLYPTGTGSRIDRPCRPTQHGPNWTTSGA